MSIECLLVSLHRADVALTTCNMMAALLSNRALVEVVRRSYTIAALIVFVSTYIVAMHLPQDVLLYILAGSTKFGARKGFFLHERTVHSYDDDNNEVVCRNPRSCESIGGRTDLWREGEFE